MIQMWIKKTKWIFFQDPYAYIVNSWIHLLNSYADPFISQSSRTRGSRRSTHTMIGQVPNNMAQSVDGN